MQKKKRHSKVKDVIGDYYKTNREVERQNNEELKKKPQTKRWSKSEIFMAVIIALGLIGILFRYVILR